MKYYKVHCVGDFGSCKNVMISTDQCVGASCKLQITDPNEASRSMLRIEFEIRERWPSRNFHNWNRSLELWRTKLWMRITIVCKSSILCTKSINFNLAFRVLQSCTNHQLYVLNALTLILQFVHNNHVPISNSMH